MITCFCIPLKLGPVLKSERVTHKMVHKTEQLKWTVLKQRYNRKLTLQNYWNDYYIEYRSIACDIENWPNSMWHTVLLYWSITQIHMSVHLQMFTYTWKYVILFYMITSHFIWTISDLSLTLNSSFSNPAKKTNPYLVIIITSLSIHFVLFCLKKKTALFFTFSLCSK